MLAFFGSKQHYRTVHTGKDPATVYIRYQNHVRTGIHCHRQIHEVYLAQVDFGDAARTFQYDGIIFLRKAVIRRTYFPAQLLASFLAEIVVCTTTADRLTVQYHLRSPVRLGFQK